MLFQNRFSGPPARLILLDSFDSIYLIIRIKRIQRINRAGGPENLFWKSTRALGGLAIDDIDQPVVN
ncbi:hypothetical protein HMF3257_08720 [Spirosoma telluris]|uniref:Uncharacterized protein n=1 Tax=Spirosoma telluris TaxID=2183553 RepID=A0A327NJ39_9BACT|nr:hypothetical protein HMF3257_08720 [Spirosoma telluris]